MADTIVVTFTRPSSEETFVEPGMVAKFEEHIAEQFGFLAQPGTEVSAKYTRTE